MKRIGLVGILLIVAVSVPSIAQKKPDYSKIDIMLIRGDFKKVIDTCSQILATDSLNHEVYYKKGLAYQNMLSDDKAFECFFQAASLNPENNNYSFTLAKAYYGKGKMSLAKPLLLKLCASDTLNWAYSYYLTSIYTQEQKYDESIKIFTRFHKVDSVNYVFLDKLGYAYLRQGEIDKGIEMFKRSLELNPKNTNAIKNLAYLHTRTFNVQTAINLLTKGIGIDSSDMDLYARRASIYYSMYNYPKALTDYLRILSSGDSSAFNLKRAGLSYANITETNHAISLLEKAYQKDTTDLETLSTLALNLSRTKDLKSSISYYRILIKLINPAIAQMGLYNLLLAGVLKEDDQVVESIEAYVRSQQFRSDNSVFMIIANLYDEKLKDIPNAIKYYEIYLKRLKNSKDEYETDYTDSITKRIEALKKMKKSGK